MARANLNINQAITDEFIRAQESRDVRFLKIKVEGESIVLDGVVNRQGTAQEDFESTLVDALSDTEALFLIFCLTDGAEEATSWMLMAWVPDGCRVRDKMLYSSSREDLKRSIGLGYFKSEYAANLRSDVTWEQFQASQSKEFDRDLLSEGERLLLEEKALTQNESGKTRSTAMGVMPFQLAAAAEEKLAEFQAGGVSYVELTVEAETVQLVSAGTLGARGEGLQQRVSQDQASFIAVRLTNASGDVSLFFIFCCPENVPVRTKMTMSSSKASVLAAAQQQGLKFDRALEVRGADEIDDLLFVELNPAAAEAGGMSSSAASLSHSKPQRPGRGGPRKVSKFKADEGGEN